jgi:hypothetical protein
MLEIFWALPMNDVHNITEGDSQMVHISMSDLPS